jgi:hypothetical protein
VVRSAAGGRKRNQRNDKCVIDCVEKPKKGAVKPCELKHRIPFKLSYRFLVIAVLFF